MWFYPACFRRMLFQCFTKSWDISYSVGRCSLRTFSTFTEQAGPANRCCRSGFRIFWVRKMSPAFLYWRYPKTSARPTWSGNVSISRQKPKPASSLIILRLTRRSLKNWQGEKPSKPIVNLNHMWFSKTPPSCYSVRTAHLIWVIHPAVWTGA